MDLKAPINDSDRGIYDKYDVRRTDGSSEPGGKHHGDQHFVLNLTTDKHAVPAILTYAESCQQDFPALARDLRAIAQEKLQSINEFAPVPETTLPNGTVVPAFQVARYLSSKGAGSIAQSIPFGEPWVDINYHDARKACEAAGAKLITELQWLAIAHDISQQDINWTGGKVGEGKLYQGLHKDSVNKAMPASFSSSDPEERRWHQLSNGERIYDFAGNAYSWAFDNLQGDDDGLIAKKFAKDSRSISNIPAKPEKKGVGWYPNAGTDWSGRALIRGGCWFSGSYAGVFSLFYVFPDRASGGVGFRCTK